MHLRLLLGIAPKLVQALLDDIYYNFFQEYDLLFLIKFIYSEIFPSISPEFYPNIFAGVRKFLSKLNFQIFMDSLQLLSCSRTSYYYSNYYNHAYTNFFRDSFRKSPKSLVRYYSDFFFCYLSNLIIKS